MTATRTGFLLLSLTLGFALPSCTTPKKRAYCGVAFNGNAYLVPDSPQVAQQVEQAVSSQGLQSNLAGRKPNVVLLSVSEDLTIVDAITLFSNSGSEKINTAPFISIFKGGQPAKADFARRKIVPR